MDLTNKAKDLRKKYDSFWKFVTFEFAMNHFDEIEDIIYNLREYNFVSTAFEENCQGTHRCPPRYDIKTIKELLKKNNCEYFENASEQELCKHAYESFITLLSNDIESYLQSGYGVWCSLLLDFFH